MTIYGASVGIWGIGHWIESSSEMKALNVVVSTQNSPDAGRTKLDTSRIPLASALGVQYSTDPIEPGSVTEQTTRQLDERVSQPSLPGQSE